MTVLKSPLPLILSALALALAPLTPVIHRRMLVLGGDRYLYCYDP